jgi:hypothetical protein
VGTTAFATWPGARGAVKRALAAALVLLGAADAAADPCTGVTEKGGRFATCFDPGNRLSLTVGSEGFGGALALRNEVHFDDEPDLVWRLEHTLLDVNHAIREGRFIGGLYRGVFIRHARDGHIVIPLGTPKKVFLPFDIGGYAEVGTLSWRPGERPRLTIMKTGALFDLARSTSFRRRFAFGPAARWTVDIEKLPKELGEHHVAPFSTAVAMLHLEDHTGRTVGDVRAEAGMVWHSTRGWKAEARAEATLERIMLAINDRPIALTLGVGYETEAAEAIARVGARIVLAQRRDPRVDLAGRPTRPSPALLEPARDLREVEEPRIGGLAAEERHRVVNTADLGCDQHAVTCAFRGAGLTPTDPVPLAPEWFHRALVVDRDRLAARPDPRVTRPHDACKDGVLQRLPHRDGHLVGGGTVAEDAGDVLEPGVLEAQCAGERVHFGEELGW